MERELERRVSHINKEACFNKLVEVNPIDLPISLIDQEIEDLKHQMYHRIFGHQHHVNEKIRIFLEIYLKKKATHRVHLGLLFSEFVSKQKLSVDEARVNAMIDKLASAYEDPQELRNWYQNKEKRHDIEMAVMEEMVVEKLCEHATVTHTAKTYNEIMNPSKDSSDSQGEK